MRTHGRAVALVFLPLLTASAAEIGVPLDHAKIQAALDAARDGDTVLVAPGDYAVIDRGEARLSQPSLSGYGF
jgi:hypothetical protein